MSIRSDVLADDCVRREWTLPSTALTRAARRARDEQRRCLAARRSEHAALGVDGVDEARGRHVERWVAAADTIGDDDSAADVRDLVAGALFDRDLRASRRAQIDGAYSPSDRPFGRAP